MIKDKVRLLVIDDDPKVGWALAQGLSPNFEVLSARDGQEGLALVSSQKPELVLLDIKMPNMSGLEVLDKIKHMDTQLDVIMLSGHGDTQNVVESIRKGATEFINKPFDIKEVEIHLHNAVERNRLKKEVLHLRSELKEKGKDQTLIGDTPIMSQIRGIIDQIADSDLTVLIRGESGTGKEIVARRVHTLSSQKEEPFIKVNCAAIPRDLLEAELFGYEKGAFTGAHKTKPGRFEVANKGTIFLDEIGDMPLDLQSKLLQVLEQHEFVRVGGIQSIKVDVRIICATNRNLEKALETGAMRDDLYYRLNEITIHLPSLRERKLDIPILVDHFMRKYNESYSKSIKALSPRSMKQVQDYHWPGNVRQLENLIKQIVVREEENIIPETLRLYSEPTGDSAYGTESKDKSLSLKKRIGDTVAREERRLIGEVLTKTNWNRRKASQLLEISYRSLLYKIKEYNLGG